MFALGWSMALDQREKGVQQNWIIDSKEDTHSSFLDLQLQQLHLQIAKTWLIHIDLNSDLHAFGRF